MKNFYSKDHLFSIGILEKYTSVEDFALMNEKMSRFSFKKGQELFQQNTNPLGIYWLTKGTVKTNKNLNGKQQILRLYQPDQIFGYECILSGRKHPYSVEALQEVEVFIIPKEVFLSVLERNKDLSEQLLIIVANDLVEIEDQFMDVVYKPVRSKIADIILSTSIYSQNGNDHSILKNIYNRENIAGLAGTTRESVIRILSDLKKEGIIEIDGKNIHIINKKELKNISLNY